MSALVNKLQAFATLSQEDVDLLDRLSRRSVREVAPRHDLVREGDRSLACHLVLDGWACRYKTLPDGRRQIVSFLLPGDLCDLNLYVLKEMDHSIGAITRLRIAEIAREEMDLIGARHPRLAQALCRDELVSNAIQREWTLNVGQRSAYERISHLLLEIYFRLTAVRLANELSCPFPLTQTDIADATGLTAVHVNRTLQELRRDGLIEIGRKQLHLLDLKGLMSAAMFTPHYLHLDHEGRH